MFRPSPDPFLYLRILFTSEDDCRTLTWSAVHQTLPRQDQGSLQRQESIVAVAVVSDRKLRVLSNKHLAERELGVAGAKEGVAEGVSRQGAEDGPKHAWEGGGAG